MLDEQQATTTTAGDGGQQTTTGTGDGQQQATTTATATSSDWRQSIPAEYRDAPALKDVKDPGSLAKQFVDLQRYLGNAIRIPGEDAGETGRAEFLAKIQKHAPELIRRPDMTDEQAAAEFWEMAGVPKDPAGYEVEEGITLPEERLSRAREVAKKLGITKKAFNQFMKDQIAAEAVQAEQTKQQAAEDMAGLAQEWGLATEGRIADVKKFAEVMNLPQSFRDALAEGKVGSDWMKAIHGIIQQFGGMGEGKQVAFQPGGSIPDGPAEIRAKLAEIEANPAYLDSRAPQHNSLVTKRVELYKQLGKQQKAN